MAADGEEEELIELGFDGHFEHRSGTMDNAIIDGRNSVSRSLTETGVFSVSLSNDHKCISFSFV